MLMEKDQFIRAIRNAPGDGSLRLVYADWLEERSDIRAEYLRLQAALPKLAKRREYPALKARRDYLRSQVDLRWLDAIGDLAPGHGISGGVKRVTADAVYLDLAPFTGVLHVQDMSWTRRPVLTELYSIGEEVEAVILKVHRRRRRIMLGVLYRQDPSWQYIADTYWVGTVIAAEVGHGDARSWFLRMEPGVSGRLPRQGLSPAAEAAAEQCMRSGARLQVRVAEIDFERGIITFETAPEKATT
jgi:small subunit ribosomal protein S1